MNSIECPIEYVPKRYDESYNTLITKYASTNKVIVAILDTGVDPGSNGLTTCPDGSPKLIDIYDCTGSDDVNTLNRLKYIVLQDNIKLLLNSNKFGHVFEENDLFYYGTRSLKTFVSDRFYAKFEKSQQKVIDDIILRVFTYTKIIEQDTKYYSLIETGISNQFWILDEYNLNQNYGSIDLGINTTLNFGLHVYNQNVNQENSSNDENQLITSLIFSTGSHATHVAGIMGAYFQDNESANGINPYVQFISLKISDSRFDGMETSHALCRALDIMIKYNCKIANYSFGEPVAQKDGLDGKFISMLNEYVKKYNMLFITSAGNAGPTALSIGCPKMSTDNVIVVGAYTDHVLLEKMYFSPQNDFNKGVYQWSSRGPTFNSSMGVDLIASGCALSSYPPWFKSNMDMANGTSMSCPNAVGIISIILSKYNNNEQYPKFYWFKKFIENTCSEIDHLECFSQGSGLIASKKITEDMYKFMEQKEYYYDVTNEYKNRGSFIKLNASSKNPDLITIKITPILYENSKINLVKFRKILRVVGDRNLYEFPNYIVVDARGTSMQVKILNVNICQSSFIKFYEDNQEEFFAINYPINIIVYDHINSSSAQKKHITFKAGHINRIYVSPNENVLSISFNEQQINDFQYDTFHVDVMHLSNQKKYTDGITNKVYLNKKQMYVPFIMDCIPNEIYEITAYIPWKSNTHENNTLELIINTNGVNLFIEKKIMEHTESTLINISKSINMINTINTINAINTSNNKIQFKIQKIITKYKPFKFEFDILKNQTNSVNRLTLFYKINKHNFNHEHSFHINSCNKIYNSDVLQSAYIYAYTNDKLVFVGNYVPKKYYGKQIDVVNITIIDQNKMLLTKYTNLILYISREPISPIIVGNNEKAILKLKINDKESLFDDDMLVADVLGENVVWIYNSPNPIPNPKKIDYEQNLNPNPNQNAKDLMMNTVKQLSDEVDTFCKKFKCFEVFAQNELESLLNKFIHIDKSLICDTLQHKISYLESLKLTTSDDIKQNILDRFIINGLNKNAPYCALEYHLNKNSNSNSQHIEKVMKLITVIENNVNYWTDLSERENSMYINKMFLEILSKTSDEKYSKIKRKYEYLIESEYSY